jgi:hypothetical protein
MRDQGKNKYQLVWVGLGCRMMHVRVATAELYVYIHIPHMICMKEEDPIP